MNHCLPSIVKSSNAAGRPRCLLSITALLIIAGTSLGYSPLFAKNSPSALDILVQISDTMNCPTDPSSLSKTSESASLNPCDALDFYVGIALASNNKAVTEKLVKTTDPTIAWEKLGGLTTATFMGDWRYAISYASSLDQRSFRRHFLDLVTENMAAFGAQNQVAVVMNISQIDKVINPKAWATIHQSVNRLRSEAAITLDTDTTSVIEKYNLKSIGHNDILKSGFVIAITKPSQPNKADSGRATVLWSCSEEARTYRACRKDIRF